MAIEGADDSDSRSCTNLRGRVGRSTKQAYCFLLYGVESREENERNADHDADNDGFEIAQKDLLLRGPGDFIGTRQHGDDSASLITSTMDAKLLEQASNAAGKS
jgi:ATP-dependent DNA helicase RecG